MQEQMTPGEVDFNFEDHNILSARISHHNEKKSVFRCFRKIKRLLLWCKLLQTDLNKGWFEIDSGDLTKRNYLVKCEKEDE